MDNIIKIFSDGSCKYEYKIGGWGCILSYNGKEKEFSGSCKDTTNQRMELTASLEALKKVNRSTIPIYVMSDSAYLVNGCSQKWYIAWRNNGWFKKSDGRQVANRDLWEQLAYYCELYNIKWQWCREEQSLHLQHCHTLAYNKMKEAEILMLSKNSNQTFHW